MKRTILYLAAALLFTVSYFKAQTTTWNFSDAAWTGYAGVTESTVYKNLGMFPGPSSSSSLMGAVESNNANFTALDGNSYTQRIKLNGGSYTSTQTTREMPSQRFFYFEVNGPSTITVSYKSGGSGNRTLYVTDGTNVIGTNLYTNSTDPLYVTFNYTGGPGTIYIAGDQALNFYRITATNVGTTETLVLGVSDASQKNVSQVFTSGSSVFLSKISTKTKVGVYTATGSLVKSLVTSSDTDFTLNPGFYVVTLENGNGKKSQKILVK